MEWGDWEAVNGGRTLPSSFPTAWAHLISQKGSDSSWKPPHLEGGTVPVAQGLRWTLAHWFLPKAQGVPRVPSPVLRRGSSTPSPGGCGPCLPCQHPKAPREGQELSREGQSHAKAQGRARRESAAILQLWTDSDSIRDWWVSHTHLELSASHPSGEHGPHCNALHWLGLLLRPFYALNKQNQSPRVKTQLQLL